MKKISIIAGIVLALLVAAVLVGTSVETLNQKGSLGSAANTDQLTNSSETLVTISSRSATLLAANTARKFATCYNRENGSGDNAWVSFGSTASVGGGLYVKASASFTIDADNLYVGAITAINRTGTEVGGSTASSSVRFLCQELTL